MAAAQTHPRVARTSAGVTIAPRRPRTVVDWVASETQFSRLAYGFLVTKYIIFIHIISQLEYIRILNPKCDNSILIPPRMTISISARID